MTTLPKLIAFDLDGTLLTSQKRVTDRTVSAIRELRIRGVRIILCTGRPPRNTRSFMNQLEINTAIVYNGAGLHGYRNNVTTHVQTLSKTTAQVILKKMRETFSDIQVGLETLEGWYLDQNFFDFRQQIREEPDQNPPNGVGRVERFLEGQSAIKLLFRHPHKSALELSRSLSKQSIYQTWSASSVLEVMHPQVNKGNALCRLAKKLGIEREETAAFGDQHNDREMLLWAGTSVAPANASPQIRAISNVLTTSNDEHGIARVLENWLGKS